LTYLSKTIIKFRQKFVFSGESMKTKLLIVIVAILLSTSGAFAQKAEPNRIKFAKGKTAATITGTLSNNQEMDYVFGAKARQKVTLKVSSNPKGYLFSFSVKGDGGIELETQLDSYSNYTFTAPETGDYLVFVTKRPTEKVPKAKFLLTLSVK